MIQLLLPSEAEFYDEVGYVVAAEYMKDTEETREMITRTITTFYHHAGVRFQEFKVVPFKLKLYLSIVNVQIGYSDVGLLKSGIIRNIIINRDVSKNIQAFEFGVPVDFLPNMEALKENIALFEKLEELQRNFTKVETELIVDIRRRLEEKKELFV